MIDRSAAPIAYPDGPAPLGRKLADDDAQCAYQPDPRDNETRCPSAATVHLVTANPDDELHPFTLKACPAHLDRARTISLDEHPIGDVCYVEGALWQFTHPSTGFSQCLTPDDTSLTTVFAEPTTPAGAGSLL